MHIIYLNLSINYYGKDITVKIVIRACTDPVGDPLQETETETEKY